MAKQSPSKSASAGLRTPTWTAEELDKSTEEFCREYSLPKPAKQPQIYDAFMFNSELDMLEVRLLELYDFVDSFVIREIPFCLSFQTLLHTYALPYGLLAPSQHKWKSFRQ